MREASRLSRLIIRNWSPELGAAAVCFYFVGLAIPALAGLSLVFLAAIGVFVSLHRPNRPFAPAQVRLLIPVLIFLFATGFSIFRSEDLGRSLRLSAPLLPALLVFCLVADHFDGPRHTRLLYFTLSALGLAVSLELSWNAWRRGWAIPPGWQNWLSGLPSPLLVVPNDSVLLAVIAPLSLALVSSESNARKVLPAASLLLSVIAISLIQSRTATLTVVAAIVSAAVLVRPRVALVVGSAVVGVALLLDACLGFPLLAKFGLIWDHSRGQIWDSRIPIWSAAWTAFVTSPLLGHGPHTFDYVSPDSIRLRWAHNLYLETLGEQGIMGLIALGLLLFSGLRAAWSVNQAQPAEVRLLGAGALAAMLSFCFAAVFELSFLRQWVVVFLFTLLAVIAQLAYFTHKQEQNT